MPLACSAAEGGPHRSRPWRPGGAARVYKPRGVKGVKGVKGLRDGGCFYFQGFYFSALLGPSNRARRHRKWPRGLGLQSDGSFVSEAQRRSSLSYSLKTGNSKSCSQFLGLLGFKKPQSAAHGLMRGSF